jgi:hypothetical protein
LGDHPVVFGVMRAAKRLNRFAVEDDEVGHAEASS